MHINWGGQYDPHYDNPIVPEFKMCHPRVRNAIYNLSQNGDYDNIYLIFRANKLYQNSTNKHFLTGYYKIDQKNLVWDYNYDDPILYASNFRLLKEIDAIDVTNFVIKNKYYRPFSSKANNGKYHNMYIKFIETMEDKENYIDEYINETSRVESIFQYYEFENGVYQICNKCTMQKKCHLIKRINNKGKLFNRLPKTIADIIKNHYKEKYKGVKFD